MKNNNSFTTVRDISLMCDSLEDFEKKASFIASSEETINKKNILSFTLINVLSSTICLVGIFLIETINLSFVGHTDDGEVNLASVGVGNIILNFFSLFLVFGSLGALDTVGSFCYGRQDYNGLNTYTQRMRIIIILCFIFLTLPSCLYSDCILKFCGISDEIAEKANVYTINMIPTIFLVFLFNLNVRFLQVMHDYLVVCIIAVVSVTIHYCLNYIMFTYYVSNYYTIAFSSLISYSFAFLSSSFYIHFIIDEKKRMKYSFSGVFQREELWFYTKLSFFSALQHYGDFIGYEVIGFLGCYMKLTESNAASLIILNYTVITGYIYSGSSYPLSHAVGYCLGKEEKSFYEYIVKLYSILNLIVCFMLWTFTVYFDNQILGFYTNVPLVIELASPILYLYSFFMVVDCFNVMMQSILRGTGNQYIPSIWNILITIIVTIPVGCILAFVIKMGIIGLWIGVFSFMTTMLFISSFYVYRIDFYKECSNMKAEMNLLVKDEERPLLAK